MIELLIDITIIIAILGIGIYHFIVLNYAMGTPASNTFKKYEDTGIVIHPPNNKR